MSELPLLNGKYSWNVVDTLPGKYYRKKTPKKQKKQTNKQKNKPHKQKNHEQTKIIKAGSSNAWGLWEMTAITVLCQ